MANGVNIIILAGGKSSRMGQDKGLMKIKGIEIIKYLIKTTELLTNQITIISNNKEYEKFGYSVVHDLINDIGPIGGLYTGLKTSKSDINLVLSCDVPLVSVELLEALLKANTSNLNGIVAKHNDKVHPLIGLYSKKLLNHIEGLIKSERYSMKGIYQLDCVMVNDLSCFPKKEFLNLNAMNDIEEFKQLMHDS